MNILGNHFLFTLKSNNLNKLLNVNHFLDFTNSILKKLNVDVVGVSFHSFENKSYTVAYCLKESHICIHTWPEINSVTMDVYFCNYLKNNEPKAEEVSIELINFFESEIVKKHKIER